MLAVPAPDLMGVLGLGPFDQEVNRLARVAPVGNVVIEYLCASPLRFRTADCSPIIPSRLRL